jgi:Mn2+/Fe2+ NRAMP family transporter
MTSPASDEPARHRLVETVSPPTNFSGILRRLGPGLIIAASIVGSGELIGTTKTGADAGYSLMWLILIGCVIKVFVQVEFGRYAVAEGVPTIEALDQMPGPRLHVSWLVWAWLIMFIASAVAQLGGILGGVGQLIASKWPITGDFIARLNLIEEVRKASVEAADKAPDAIAKLDTLAAQLKAAPSTVDDVYYSIAVAIVTSIMLLVGRYRVVQNVSTFLVAGFTLVTVFNVFALPYFGDVNVGWAPLWHGLSFHLPEKEGALKTALATFGIIGVGASEVIAYPYWCIESGYARFTGKRDGTESWALRARGWMRVMRVDCWVSMVIYTFATMAFYVLGAAVLHHRGLSPSKEGLIRTLESMYTVVFGVWGGWVFLFGAFAVLYSTLFVATAGNARVAADGLGVFKLIKRDDKTRIWWIQILCGTLPFMQLGVYIWSKDPVALVILSGLAQAFLLPMLGLAALYFRYKKCDPRIAPGKTWDVFLWLSVFGMALAGGIGAYGEVMKLLGK